MPFPDLLAAAEDVSNGAAQCIVEGQPWTRYRLGMPVIAYFFTRCSASLTQSTAVDLVGRRQRQFVDKPYKTWMLVRGSVRERELLDFIFGGMPAGLRNNENHWLLPLHFIIDRHHSGLADIGVPFQHALDVARIDVFATAAER